MPTHSLGYRPSGGLDGEADISELDAFEAALHDSQAGAAAETGALGPADQLARDKAAIERAIAALRRVEPALESWSEPEAWTADPPAAASRKPRPVWLLIGLVWLSTALATAGAVVAIAVLAG